MDLLTCFVWFAECAEVRSILIFVFADLFLGHTEAVWVNPFAARAFTLEHQVFD